MMADGSLASARLTAFYPLMTRVNRYH